MAEDWKLLLGISIGILIGWLLKSYLEGPATAQLVRDEQGRLIEITTIPLKVSKHG